MFDQELGIETGEGKQISRFCVSSEKSGKCRNSFCSVFQEELGLSVDHSDAFSSRRGIPPGQCVLSWVEALLGPHLVLGYK